MATKELLDMNVKGIKIIRTAAFLSWGGQLLLIVASAVIIAFVGIRPESAVEAFEAFGIHPLYGLLKDEILIMVMLSFYYVTFLGLYLMLKDYKYDLALIAVLFTLMSITLAIASHSGFSMMHLSKLYHGTTDGVMKASYLAAGDAIIAKNIWHSTASYFTGIMLQGSGVMISLAMIGSGKFRKLTIVSGILGNGIDLIQHVIHPVLPNAAEIILMFAGPFYLIWYVTLGMDFYRYSRSLKLDLGQSKSA